MATILIGAVILVLLVFAVRYLVKNGACADCPAKAQCHADGMKTDCSGCAGCTQYAVCHSLSGDHLNDYKTPD